MTYNGQDLHYAAYSMGSQGFSLDRCLYLIVNETGPLDQHEFRQIVEGYQEGLRDWEVHRTEFEYVESTEPRGDWDDIPF